MNKPLITCIIPSYNRVNLLEEAIESIIHQTFQNWEMIIVDDNSTDNTKHVVEEYILKDNRIKYFRNPGKGGASARNFGIKKALGDYIAFLDDDDISLPHRFISQLNAARKSGSNYIVSGYFVKNRNTGKIISEKRMELKGAGAGFPSRWFISRKLLEKAGGFDENFPAMQDIELSYRLSDYETFTLHNDIVSVIYPTFNSVSTQLRNALIGKELLMQKLGNKMHIVEASWWYFVIAMDYYKLNDVKSAIKYLKIAAEINPGIRMDFAFNYARTFFKIGKRIKTVNAKFLNLWVNSTFPVLVKHQAV